MIDYRHKAFEKAVSLTLELYQILKSIEVRDHTGAWLQFLHWNQIMNKEQAQARLLMDNIVRIINKQNNQISSRLIYDRIIYDLIQKAIWFTEDYPDFPSSVREELTKLFEYNAVRTIDIPLKYLVTEKLPVKFGTITIYKITEKDRGEGWWKKILASGGDNQSVQAYARVISHGDLEKSRENALIAANDMLIFLRAIGFPITTEPQNQFGLLNEYSTPLIPYRIDIPKENYRMEFPVQLSTKVSILYTYEIQKDIFNQISLSILIRLQRLIDEDYLKPSANELKRKFFLGLRWLGEATKPDIVNARFVKLSFSLEGLIGGGIEDTRETKIILAKRCAIVAGKSIKEQKKLYNAILKYYHTRSEIVHGADKMILENELSSFGDLVRKIAWALLEIIDDFKSINELHNWVLTHPSWSLL